MQFSVKPLIIFAQRRQATLDTNTTSAGIPTDPQTARDDIPVGDNNNTRVMSTLHIETKYDLRLHISHDASIRISLASEEDSIQDPKTSVHDDIIECCNSKLQTLDLNAATPSPDPVPSPSTIPYYPDDGTAFLWFKDPKSDPIPSGPISYRLFPDVCYASFLFYKHPLDLLSSHVDEDVFEDRYPSLVPFYFKWADTYNDALFYQIENVGGNFENLFPSVDEEVAWETEGFLLACCLALQSDVRKVEYSPSGKTYRLRKGQLDKELVRFLMDMEELLSPA